MCYYIIGLIVIIIYNIFLLITKIIIIIYVLWKRVLVHLRAHAYHTQAKSNDIKSSPSSKQNVKQPKWLRHNYNDTIESEPKTTQRPKQPKEPRATNELTRQNVNDLPTRSLRGAYAQLTRGCLPTL